MADSENKDLTLLDEETSQDEKAPKTEFAKKVAKRLHESFASIEAENLEYTNERLSEANKKLPTWSLEPPFSFNK